jgi:hypothetical protein
MRIEHPSPFINQSQYGKFASALPSADYRLAYNDPNTKRGVYSFCMCPGGEVINSSSEQGLLCVNGMSYSQRNSPFSNAAIVTTVSPSDFGVDPLSGIAFQRDLERNAFELGGGSFAAPIQLMRDFIKGVNSGKCPKTSYSPTVKESNLSSLFPPFIREPLVRGLLSFDQKIRGFIDNGVCIGVETRTSSPIRIVRNASFQSVSHKNLYPIGEGAGYAGGIVSSAVDGIRCAELILSSPRE